MTPGEINVLRLVSQGIGACNATSPVDVVSHLAGIQAQDYAAAKWAIGLRLPGSVEAEIDSGLLQRAQSFEHGPCAGRCTLWRPEMSVHYSPSSHHALFARMPPDTCSLGWTTICWQRRPVS